MNLNPTYVQPDLKYSVGREVRVMLKPNNKGASSVVGRFVGTTEAGEYVVFSEERVVCGHVVKDGTIAIPRENVSYLVFLSGPLSQTSDEKKGLEGL